MNEIDEKVLRVAEDYYREHGKPPALIVVHPWLGKQMTRTYFHFPQIPKLDVSIFMLDTPPEYLAPPEPIRVEVKTLDTSHMSLYEFYLSRETIECLDINQVWRILEANPHLKRTV